MVKTWTLLLLALPLSATVWTIHPSDSATTIYTTIQGIACGDTVNIQAGTYNMANSNLARIYMPGLPCTAGTPIVIQASDTSCAVANRPIFDYTGFPLDTGGVPGSLAGGSSDAARGAWQIRNDAYLTLDCIHIKGAKGTNVQTVDAVRLLNVDHVTVRRCKFEANFEGIGHNGTNDLIELNEFADNGVPGSNAQEHQLYDHGGDNLIVQSNYFHDSGCIGCGQNLHMRSWHHTIRYNWIQDASSYEWDMMTPACSAVPAGSPACAVPGDWTERELFYGNVVVTNPAAQSATKVMVFFGDNAPVTNANWVANSGKMNADIQWNTFYSREACQNGCGDSISGSAAYSWFLIQNMISGNDQIPGGVTINYSNNVMHFDPDNICTACGGYKRAPFHGAISGGSPWVVAGDNNWFDTSGPGGFNARPVIVNSCATLVTANNGNCLVTSTTTANPVPFSNIATLDLRPNANAVFGTADGTQTLPPAFEQYPGGTLVALSTTTDRGGLQFSTATCTLTSLSPLPNATVGISYSYQFTVTGCITPLTFTITAGTPPFNLMVGSPVTGGTLTGTAVVSGTYNFTVRVTDANSSTSSVAYALTVLSPQPVPLMVSSVVNGQTTGVGGTPCFLVANPATCSIATTAGHTGILFTSDQSSVALSSVSDTVNGTWQQLTNSPAFLASNARASMFYFCNMAGGNITLSANFASNPTRLFATYFELSGTNVSTSTSCVDTSHKATGVSTAPSAGSVITAVALDLLVSVVGVQNNVNSVISFGGGWTQLANDTAAGNGNGAIAYQNVTNTGTYGDSISSTTNVGYGAITAAFAAAGSSPQTNLGTGMIGVAGIQNKAGIH